jgi:hypothetical protein
MRLFLLFGVLAGLVLRQFSAGAVLFWLLIAVHSLFTTLVLTTLFQAKMSKQGETLAGGHLVEYVILSLTFDSGMVPAYWVMVPWQRENVLVIAIVCLLLFVALLLARNAVPR